MTLKEKEIFKELVEGREAVIIVSTSDDTLPKAVGELFIDQKNVKDLLKEKASFLILFAFVQISKHILTLYLFSGWGEVCSIIPWS